MKYLHLFIIALLLYPPLSSHAYSHLSPYSYCGGDPVNCVDPTGCVIEGVTKKDAAMAVEDFRAMFPGDGFANFRSLIVQSGKKLILRVMGIPFINTGIDHGPKTLVPQPSLLPLYR